jgi:hypothetical protein
MLIEGLASFGHPSNTILSIFIYTPLWWYAFHLQWWGCSSFTLLHGSWFFLCPRLLMVFP